MISKVNIFIILLATSALNGPQPFDRAVSQLFFGLNVKEAKDHLLDSLMSKEEFKHRLVDKPYSWTSNRFISSKKTVWQQNHRFSFFKSPLPDMKIDSGEVCLTIGKTTDSTLLSTYNWWVFFKSKNQADSYYRKMQELFSKTGAVHERTKIATNDAMDTYIANRNEKFEEIAMTLTRSPYNNQYYIQVDLLGSHDEY